MEKIEKFISKKAAEKSPEKEIPEDEEKLPPNVKLVETEKGKFRIAYGKAHMFKRNQEDFGEADAWIPELIGFDYTLSKKLVEEEFNKKFRKSILVREIFEKLEKEKKPIFLVDITEDEMAALIKGRTAPEIEAILVAMRNGLIAQKAETTAERLGVGDKKTKKLEIAITIGADHYEIEKTFLENGEKRVKSIDEVLSIPGKNIKENLSTIATIARFDFNKEKKMWELNDRFKDPLLAKIEK